MKKLLLCVLCLALIQCTNNAGEKAGEGASTGAVAGAVGGFVGALVWGGNPAEGAVKGAAVGAASGAAIGGMQGAEMDAAEAEQKRQQDIAELRGNIGEDAYAGAVALAECKYEVAMANAKVARKSSNEKHALAGLWLMTLVYSGEGKQAEAEALYPDLVKEDPNVNTVEEAAQKLDHSKEVLGDLRIAHDTASQCNQ